MKSTVARKLAAIRTFYRHMVERGELEANPAELVSSPKKDAYLPRVLKPDEVAELLERIPARRRSTCATARCSSWPTRPACAPRSS